MTSHDKKQAVRLNLIQALFDAMKQDEAPRSMRHNRISNLEERTFNFVNDYRTEAFPVEDMRHAGEIIDMINVELEKRWPEGNNESN